MLGFQTLSCLHDIPIVRSSTDKLQDVYAKAKDTSALIRFPCNLAETVADKSLKFALTVVNPFVKPLRGPVRLIDDYAAQKIRQIESKYPVINTPTEDVVNTINEKTEPVRNVMNSVKDTTTSTIQHGKETVSNVATATVNKASSVADSVFSFCETHVPGVQRRNSGKSTGLSGCVLSNVGSLINFVFQTAQLSLIWFRMLVVFSLLKTKQINDVVLNKIQQKPFSALPKRLLILVGAFLERLTERVRPDERALAELKKSKQQVRLSQQPSFKRTSAKPDPSVKTRQNVVVNKQETVVTRTNDSNHVSHPDYSNEYDRLADNDEYTTEPVDLVASGDIAQLRSQIKARDVELLYSRVPADVLPVVDNQEPLNEDQQHLRGRVFGGRKRNSADENDNVD